MKAYNFNLSSVLSGILGIHIFNFGNYLIIDSCHRSHTKTKIKAPID